MRAAPKADLGVKIVEALLIKENYEQEFEQVVEYARSEVETFEKLYE